MCDGHGSRKAIDYFPKHLHEVFASQDLISSIQDLARLTSLLKTRFELFHMLKRPIMMPR